MIRIGLISDTHGLLRPQACDFLQGSHHIIHAGDIGSPAVLQELAVIAQVTAVRGNNDMEEWAEPLLETEWLQFGEVNIYVLHDLSELDIEPKTTGISVVISGHSHKPSIEEREGVLYINPGSAGPRRFKLPIAVAELIIDGESVSPRIMYLE